MNFLFTEHLWTTASSERRLWHRYFSVNFVKFSGRGFCRPLPSNHFSHDVFVFLFADKRGLQRKINIFGGAIVKQEKEFTHKSIQFCVVMEIKWKVHCQVAATHIPTQALEVEEKEELINLLKWAKFSFYVIVDREIFTYQK